ncbi:MAG: hypothetical protein IKK81_01100 [Prevotella sp.]|nr:hypothetical protein [Prevotella sp.]
MKKVFFWIFKFVFLMLVFGGFLALIDFIAGLLGEGNLLSSFWVRLIIFFVFFFFIYDRFIEYRLNKFVYDLVNKIFK